MNKECVVVLGMHRSGTSVLSGLISLQGFYVGLGVLPAQDDNPKGFYENIKVYRLNEEILESYNTSWDNHTFTVDKISPEDLSYYEAKARTIIEQDFGAEKRIFIKDPRMCLFFPLWEKVLAEMDYTIKIVLAYRSPMEVANSLGVRNQLPLEKSLMIWSHHFFQAEKNSRSYPRMLVRYDKDIHDLDGFLHLLSDFLETELTDEIVINSHELYSPKLKHHEFQLDDLFDGAPTYLKQFVAILKKGKLGSTIKLDDIIDEFYNSQNYYLYNESNLSSNILTLEEEVIVLKQEVKFKLREIEQQQIQIANAKNDHAKSHVEFNEIKADFEQQLISKTVEINNSEEKLAIGEQLFRKAFLDRKLNKNIRSILKGQNFYKIEKILSLFSKKRDKQLLEEKSLIVESGLFSPFYYLTQNVDVWRAGVDPLNHFCMHGWKEGRNPSQCFNGSNYLKVNDDIAKSAQNPLVHYIMYGQKEGRSPEIDVEVIKRKEGNISQYKISNNLSTYQKAGLIIFRKISKKFLSVKLINKLENNPSGFFRDSKNKYVRMYSFIFMLSNVRYVPNIESKKVKYVYHEPSITREIEQEMKDYKDKPLMSIIMPVYNSEKKWIEKAIRSIQSQWYENWELNIVGDADGDPELISFLQGLNNPKIKIKSLSENSKASVTSNKALEMSSGEYVVLMGHDDELTPDALFEMVKVINETGAEFIYSDEDKLDVNGDFFAPNYKPDYSPDMFLSQNYLSHLTVIKKDLVEAVNGWSVDLEGEQDYDLYLKVLEHTDKIAHIPKVIYHYRVNSISSFGLESCDKEAGVEVLGNALKRRGIKAEVENSNAPGTYRIKYAIKGEPLVSIIIPFKDMPDLLEMCISAILDKSTYQNYEILGISNNSDESKTYSMMKYLEEKDSRVNFHEYNQPFNYSSINNYAVNNHAKGKHVLLLNNDVEVITPEWIEELLMFSQRPDVGAVGAKLYYPDDTIQHAGVIIGIGQTAGHSHKRLPRSSNGYFGRINCVQNISAVTAACLMVKKTVYEEVEGLNEKDLKVAFNDVDVCLRIREMGYLNVYTPHCEAYHYESISRGYEDNPEKITRFNLESKYLKNRHKNILKKGDPYYNVNLTLSREDFQLRDVDPLINYQREITKKFKHEILVNNVLRPKKCRYICVFSHFDKDGVVDNYVINYLKALSVFSDIVFVSTADIMPTTEIKKIEQYCNQVIIKKNYGYDFGAWKTGLELTEIKVSDYEYLIFCNDSVYGPFYDLKEILDEAMSKYDVFSITDSYEKAHHLQSYFVVYSRVAFSHKIFEDFWGDFVIYENKDTLIKENEVKFSGRLIDSDLLVSSLCISEREDNLNQLHFYWDKLILDKNCPFIKIELLRDNPRNMDLGNWRNIVKKTGYDVKLIEQHLKRM